MAVSSVDLRALVYELQNEVVGAWIVNIYHLPSGIFIFKLRMAEQGTRFLLIEPGKRIHLTEFNRTMPKEPSQFGKVLRSHLRDRRINDFEQVHLDRIVKMTIGADDGRLLLVELFGEGNIILVHNPSQKILGALRYRKMRDRDIHPGKPFELPPPPDRNFLVDGTKDLDEFLSKEPKLFRALNSWLSLGPDYSRLLIRDAGIQVKKSLQLDKDMKKILVESAEVLRQRLLRNEYSPVVYLDEEEDVSDDSDPNLDEEDVSDDSDPSLDEDEEELTVEVTEDEQWADDSILFKPEQVVKILPWKQLEIEGTTIFEVPTLGKALDIYYSSQEDHGQIHEETEQLETAADRLRRRLKDQEEHQRNMLTQSAHLRKEGEALFLSYNEVDELLTTLKTARHKKVPWDSIIEKMEVAKEKGMRAASVLDRIEPKKALVMVKLPLEDEVLSLALDFRKSVNDIANAKYERAKKQEKRAKGAIIAIDMTKEKIKAAEESVSEMQSNAAAKVTILKRRKRWYEKWVWMQAPDGTIIVGGKDAATNERLVKKYMDDDDMFLHADIHGAPFVVIKTEGRKLSESVKHIAGSLGVCFSSAWKGKRSVADAFLLPPDQVSLTAPAGEFLPKGSIMMYGTKETVRDVELKLYIGVILEANWARLICGPIECMNKADLIVEIVPGDVTRGKVAKMIKQKFAAMVEGEDLVKIQALDVGDFAYFIPDNSEVISFKDKRA